jgi:hypothetical protein
LEEYHEARQESRHVMNMTPNDSRTEASTCKSSGTQPENSGAWIARIQALTAKETTSKAHMQVHTNKESCGKQLERKPGPNRAETSLGRLAWADRPSPFQARFDTPFDLAATQIIYSPLAKSHKKIDSSSAATRPRTRSRLDRKGSTRGLHLLRGILHHDQHYNEKHYGVKSLFVLGVEGGS